KTAGHGRSSFGRKGEKQRFRLEDTHRASPQAQPRVYLHRPDGRYRRRVHEWAAEITVDECSARRLISTQFPDVELGSLRLLGQGWDMTVWLVDDRLVFRFPRRETVISGLLNEIAYLPTLASLVPLPIPNPTYVGAPSPEYRWPFFGAPY